MSWIYRSSSLLSLNTTPLRDMNRDHQHVLLEGGPSGRDRFNHVIKKQLGIYGNKMTSQEKRALILRGVMWLTLSVVVFVSAIVVRISFPLPEEESITLSAGNMTELLTNSTNTWTRETNTPFYCKQGLAKGAVLLLHKRCILPGVVRQILANSFPCKIVYYFDLTL